MLLKSLQKARCVNAIRRNPGLRAEAHASLGAIVPGPRPALTFHRSYIAPPQTPPAQLAVLRKAFDETMKDPQFLADAKKMRIDIDPLPGAKIQEVVARLFATPKDIVERARKAIR